MSLVSTSRVRLHASEKEGHTKVCDASRLRCSTTVVNFSHIGLHRLSLLLYPFDCGCRCLKLSSLFFFLSLSFTLCNLTAMGLKRGIGLRGPSCSSAPPSLFFSFILVQDLSIALFSSRPHLILKHTHTQIITLCLILLSHNNGGLKKTNKRRAL